jgi:diketogulonate reductase-like aldo/keto reductase
MQKITLKDNNQIPVLGFGTWQLSGETCRKAVESALEIGYRHIDTAEMYENQPEIKKAIQASGVKRKDLFITSKVWYENLRKDDLVKALKQTLFDLGTDYLDLYLIHWPNRAIDLEESLKTMEELKNQGLIKSIGVSNFTINHLKDALATDVEFVANQVEFHPSLNQKELYEFCQNHKITLTAYSPIGIGHDLEIDLIQELAKKYNKTESQIILNWLTSKNIVVIPRSKNEKHIKENFEALDFEIEKSDLAKIENLNLNQRYVNPSFSDFEY